jgi:hypothetical protein
MSRRSLGADPCCCSGRTTSLACLSLQRDFSNLATAILAENMEEQIAAEARGVTRKDIPWNKFCSTYLHGFVVKAQPTLDIEFVKEIGIGDWEEKPFWARLRKVISDEVRYSGCSFISLSPLLTY